MRMSRTAKLGAAALALALAATACSGRDDESSDGGGSSGTAGTTPSGEAAFTISTEDCEGYEPTTGITDDEIKVGSSFAQSGLYEPYSDISKGYLAFIDYYNESEGGVDGRQVNVLTADDGYVDPSATKANVDAFVDDDGVFAIFNVVGTPNNLEIRGDLGTRCVPNLYAATGSQQMGEPGLYPWTIGSIPTYATESAIFMDWLETNKPDAQIGILYQNDDFGLGYLEPLTKLVDESDGIALVAEETYNPGETDVASQVTAIRNAGADTVLIAASGLACPGAVSAVNGQADWDVTTYASATCASKTLLGAAGEAAVGVLSAPYLKEPANPEWQDDEGVQQFLELGPQYGLSEDDLTNGTVIYGWTMGQLLVETLGMPDELTRQGAMEAAYNLPGLELPMLLPGVTVTTEGTTDPFPIESMRMGEWNGEYFEYVGELTSFEGRTVEYVD